MIDFAHGNQSPSIHHLPHCDKTSVFSMPEPVRICNYEHPLIPCDEIGGRCYEDMELLGTKWSRHLKSGDLIHRSMQVYCLDLMQYS